MDRHPADQIVHEYQQLLARRKTVIEALEPLEKLNAEKQQIDKRLAELRDQHFKAQSAPVAEKPAEQA